MGRTDGRRDYGRLSVLYDLFQCAASYQGTNLTLSPQLISESPQALLHGMVGVGLIGFVSKLHRWDESAVFFDGSSLGTCPTGTSHFSVPILKLLLPLPAVYVFGIAVYLTVTINSLRTIVDPVKDVDTREDQIMAVRVLAAGNVIIISCLGLILALQVSRHHVNTYLASHPYLPIPGRARMGP